MCEMRSQTALGWQKGEFCRSFLSHTQTSDFFCKTYRAVRDSWRNTKFSAREKLLLLTALAIYYQAHLYTNTARRQPLEEYNFCGGIQTIREENRRKIKNDCSRYRKLKNSSSRLLSLTLSLPSLITANLQWEVRHPSESQGLRLLLLTLGEQNTPQEP